MTYDPNNVFAKILRGEAPACRVYEDEFTLSFMDIMPQVPGHTLVIPKDEAENIHEANADILGATMRTVQLISGAVKRAFDAPGIMIAQLNGRAAGQTVFHLHFHILPRFEGLEFKLHARELADMQELERHAGLIRAQLE